MDGWTSVIIVAVYMPPPAGADPKIPCYILAVPSSTSVMEITSASSLSPTTSGDAGFPSTFPSHLSVSGSQLEKLNRNKATGPDGVSPRVRRTCVDQLSGILQHLFNLNLRQEKVLVPWIVYQKDLIDLLSVTINLLP